MLVESLNICVLKIYYINTNHNEWIHTGVHTVLRARNIHNPYL